MKNLVQALIFITIFSLLVGCAGHPPRKEFDPTARVQSIAVTDHAHLYAQNDTVLIESSLDEKLAGMNEDWKHELHSASVDRGVAVAAFITQVVALAICIGQNNTVNVLGWCGGSVAMGFVSVPFSRAADRHENGVINQYNQGIKTAPSAGID